MTTQPNMLTTDSIMVERPAITRPPDRRAWLLAAARFCLLAATADQQTAAKALKVLAEDATRAAREETADGR
ncbi:MAG: hypothetical protein NTW86_22465 [Candidatus Sumerlaeota bacterium]|nr:hypothetical protein [Candidatus Sumerlaeota bacterium]